MSISIMKADKMNLDLRAMILDMLKGIQLAKKRDSRSKEEARAYMNSARQELLELRTRHSMLESLARFYAMRPDLEELHSLIEKISTSKSEEAEERLSKLLFELEERFSERVQKGVLER